MSAGTDADAFPDGFFSRGDDADDSEFYAFPRFVTHIDDGAIAAVGTLYDELGIRGRVLDLMSSWVSHFSSAPDALTVLGMNPDELEANPQARTRVVHDLNAEPALPFGDDTFDHATCCVSVDYLTRPVAVFRDVARVVRTGGLFVCAFSNQYSHPRNAPGCRAHSSRSAAGRPSTYRGRSCSVSPAHTSRSRSSAQIGSYGV